MRHRGTVSTASDGAPLMVHDEVTPIKGTHVMSFFRYHRYSYGVTAPAPLRPAEFVILGR